LVRPCVTKISYTPAERRDFFLAEPPRIDAGGSLAAPARSGLDAVLDQAALTRYAVWG